MEPAQPADAPEPFRAADPAASPSQAVPPVVPQAIPAAVVPGGAVASGQPIRKTSERSPRDMALSLVVLLVPIALLLGFYRLVLDGDDPVTVDPAPAFANARAADVFTVLEPVGLPTDWQVSTATFRRVEGGATLRVGYLAPDGDPLQLVESSVPSATLIRAELGTTGPGGTVAAGNRTWQRYETRPGEEAIVLAEKGRTVIVVGATEVAQLQTLAATLHQDRG